MTTFYQPRNVPLTEGLTLLPQFGANSGATHRPMNSYALIVRDRCILFDACVQNAVPGIRRLIADGVQPVTCVLSHSDLLTADGLNVMRDEFQLPLMLHPADQKHPNARKHDIDWQDPTAPGAFGDLPVEVIHWPGHTPGSIMLYTAEHGGILLTGDSAIAPGPMQTEADPPLGYAPAGRTDNVTDEDVAQRWREFRRTPLATLAPLHGEIYANRSDIPRMIAAMINAGPPPMTVRQTV